MTVWDQPPPTGRSGGDVTKDCPATLHESAGPAREQGCIDNVKLELSAAGFVDAREVGRGGFGVVYRCNQPRLGRLVAVKVLTQSSADHLARFLREQQAMAQLTGHPNVVAVLHVGETSRGHPFLVMGFCARGCIQDRIKHHAALRMDETLRLGVKIAGALECAHELGIVHRDVKPANILLTDYGEPALCDFGIARVSDGDQFVTGTGIFAGSPAFIAPELIEGDAPSPATDVYALGATLFCCMTGHAAHDRRPGEHIASQLLRITTEPLPDLREHGVPDEVARVVERAMSRNPAQRPSAVQLGEWLQQAQVSLGLPVDDMALPETIGQHRPAFTAPEPMPLMGGAKPSHGLSGNGRASDMPQSAPTQAGCAPRRAGSRLPAPADSFIGRHRETAQLRSMLGVSRLVTLVAMGGIGKTTLAAHVARELSRDQFADGVWWVELADLNEGALVADVVAAAVGLRDRSGRGSTDVLTDHFSGLHSLIVLDNCEHLIDEVAKLVDILLHHCPHVHILATSREVLDVTGEALLPLAPLARPAADDNITLGSLAAYDAVALFTVRARAAVPDFALSAKNADAVARICAQLDGLPLAIELAAARLRALSVEQIADGLSDRFALLKRGRRALTGRQQSLINCVAWSYGLCTEAERRLWAELSVFAGTFVLEAARAVRSGDDGDQAGMTDAPTHRYEGADRELLDQLTTLVDKSILLRSDHDDIVGYRMLDTVRDYGRSQLSANDLHRLHQRHTDYYQHLMEQARSEWWSDRQVPWLRRVTLEVPNIRVAIQHALTNNPEAALHMAHLRHWMIALHGANEDRRSLELALAATPALPSVLRIDALCSCAMITGLQGDAPGAQRLVTEARGHLDAVDTPAARARVEFTDGAASGGISEYQRARDCFERAVALSTDDEHRAWAMYGLGWAQMQLGCPEALDWFEKALILTESHGESMFRAHLLFFVGIGRFVTGSPERAEQALQDGLHYSDAVHDRLSGALCLEALGWIAMSQHHNPIGAVKLMSSAAAITQAAGFSRDVWLQSVLLLLHNRCEESARQLLGAEKFAAAWSEGSILDFDEALTLTLGSG